MDELWIRVLVVAGALSSALAVVLRQRWRPRGRMTVIAVTRLEPGVYFFSSAACPTCQAARKRLGDVVDAYREFVWEDEPARFDELGIDAVPAVLVVDAVGSGRLYPGSPGRELRGLILE
jgi:hypothetical protein